MGFFFAACLTIYPCFPIVDASLRSLCRWSWRPAKAAFVSSFRYEPRAGVGDGEHVVVQVDASNGFGEDTGVDLFAAGNLGGAEAAEGGHGGGDERELLAADAGERKISGVFDAKGGDGFEGGEQTGGFLFHIGSFRLCFPSLVTGSGGIMQSGGGREVTFFEILAVATGPTGVASGVSGVAGRKFASQVVRDPSQPVRRASQVEKWASQAGFGRRRSSEGHRR